MNKQFGKKCVSHEDCYGLACVKGSCEQWIVEPKPVPTISNDQTCCSPGSRFAFGGDCSYDKGCKDSYYCCISEIPDKEGYTCSEISQERYLFCKNTKTN